MDPHPVIEPGMTPGQRIKLYRQRAGLTQEVAAQLKGCSLSAWRKWESGERQVLALHDWIEIARILRVKDLYRLTGLPMGQLPDEPAEHESVPPIREALHAYPAMLDEPADLGRMGAAVDFVWDIWHGSTNQYSRTGPMLPDLIRQVRAAASSADIPDRRDANRLLCMLYLLVRAYCKRIGAHDLSILAADRAMSAADAADDPDYIAASAWSMVIVLSTQGHIEAAAGLARQTLAIVSAPSGEPTPTRHAVTGALHLMLAIQQAKMRDEHGCVQSIDAAARAAAVTGENDAYRMVFGPTNVDIYRAETALEFSRPGEARRIAERIDVTPLPSAERRFSHYLNLARGFAVQREDLSAVQMLLRAEREASEEARINLVFRAIVRELLTRETATTRPDLRPLAERVAIT